MSDSDPPFAIIIFGLMAVTLFIIGFFSICIRECSDEHSSTQVHIPRPVTAVRSLGLDNDVIKSFPTFLYSEVKHLKLGKCVLECAVCLNEFDDVETLRLLPKCDHVFHPECIDVWLSSHTTCPVCRADLAQNDLQGVDCVRLESDRISIAIEVVEDGAVVSDRSSPFRSTMWSKFPRSHSTGHSLVQPGENVDRFTLKLPDQIRNEIMTRALNQSISLSVLPGETSSRKGYRESYRRLGSLDRSGRWMFTIGPPFFSRESSVRKSNRSASGSESEGTSKGFNLVRRLSFKRFGGSKSGEPTLIDSV